MGLIQLPTDILRYILSLVVYDAFVTNYPIYADESVETNVSTITKKGGDFYCLVTESKMTRTMKMLGLVHPKTRHILLNASKFYHQGNGDTWNYANRLWSFDPTFFVTLAQSAKRKK